jgi:hypothetical protein
MRLALALVLLVAACRRGGDPVKCEKACRNYAQLTYWADADKAIEAAPADQRDALSKQKLDKFSRALERGIDPCVTRCVSADNDDQEKCLIQARTAEQAKACVKKD